MTLNAVTIHNHPAGFNLHGDLNFTNVMPLYQQGAKLIAGFNPTSLVQIDFSGLTSANSAAIALMVDWLRYAKKAGKSLQFLNLSSEIQSLLQAAEMNHVITSETKQSSF